MSIKESCDVTDTYRSNWKNDYKHRKQLAKKEKEEGLLEQSWEIISKQDWNELTRSWVITTLKAPASMISSDLIDRLGLDDGK